MDVQKTARINSTPRIRANSWVSVLLLALILRGVWLLLVPVEPVSDSVRYDFFAQRLAQGLGYTEIDGRRTAYWPVGPSFLYSLVYRLAGPESDGRFPAAAGLNLILGVFTVGLTMHLGRKWFSPQVGVIAGLLLACWPSLIQFTTVLSSEALMLFFMLAAFAAWYADRPAWWLRAILVGMLLAAAAFMRPTVLLLPAVIGLSDLFLRQPRWRTVAELVIMVLAVSACIAPWSIRNYRVFGEFVPISTNGGVNFWMGNNPETTGSYQSPRPAHEFGGEVARDRALKAEAFAYIQAKPGAFVLRTLIKAVRLHERETIGIGWNEPGLTRRLTPLLTDQTSAAITAGKLVSTTYWWLMLVLAALGLVRLVRHRGLLSALLGPPLLIWVYFTGLHAATVIQDRYHFAAIPFIALVAAASCVAQEPPSLAPQAGTDKE